MLVTCLLAKITWNPEVQDILYRPNRKALFWAQIRHRVIIYDTRSVYCPGACKPNKALSEYLEISVVAQIKQVTALRVLTRGRSYG